MTLKLKEHTESAKIINTNRRETSVDTIFGIGSKKVYISLLHTKTD